MMTQLSSFRIAVAQPVDHEPWDTSPVIPMDDRAVLTTLLPLVVLLVVFGATLLTAVQGCASPGMSTCGLGPSSHQSDDRLQLFLRQAPRHIDHLLSWAFLGEGEEIKGQRLKSFGQDVERGGRGHGEALFDGGELALGELALEGKPLQRQALRFTKSANPGADLGGQRVGLRSASHGPATLRGGAG